MTHKPCQIRLTDVDKEHIEGIRVRMGLPSASSAIRYAVTRVYTSLLTEELRAEADEARRNYNRELGLP